MSQPRPDPPVSIRFSRGLAAAELWRFGEERLAEQVLELDDDAWSDVLELGAHYRREVVPVPVAATKVTNGHVMCFACMHRIEGSIRPLSRARRRPRAAMPDHIAARADEALPPLHGDRS